MHENVIQCGFCGILIDGIANKLFLLHYQFLSYLNRLTLVANMSFARAYFFYFYFSYSSPTAVKSGKRS